MALTDTKFSSNTAVIAGGGIFAGYLAAIRFNCSNASLDTNLEYYEEKEWQALKRLESEADICPSWKGNNGTVYGTEIGTYAYNATTRIEKDNVSSVCESGGENCVIDGYRAGSDLAKAEVKLIDAFGGGPARNYRTVNAMLSSARGQLIVGSVVLPMEEGNCTFQSIRSFVPPEKYKLTLEFDEDAIEDIGITVIVRECSVGEIVAPGTGICQECSNTTYSFDPLEDVCQQCPENGNCETRVIMPDDGYWHDTPCSDRLHRCLPTSACTFEERSEGLRNLTQNVTNCSLSREWREEYNRVQCAKVQPCFLSRIQAICVFIEGSRGASLRILFTRIWFWLVGEVPEVSERIRQRCSHSVISFRIDGADGRHRQWHTQCSEDGSQRASSPNCVYANRWSDISSFS